jgi:hypothetical protein
MSAARRTMKTQSSSRTGLDARRTVDPARKVPALAVALLSALVAAAAPPAAASDGFGIPEDPPPELQRTRSKRWWLDYWCHSMQEQCFVAWMDVTTGSTAWRTVMTPPQVNALYAWWLAEIWTGSKG